MSEFHGPSANERIEPVVNVGPLHLHERTGFGLSGQSKKDPTNAVNGVDGEDGNYPSIPGFFPPPSLLPIDFPIPPPFLPPPLTFPTNPDDIGVPPDLPASNPPPFPFVYKGGAWWAPVEVDCDGNQIEATWVQFAPCCGGTSSVLNSMPAPAALEPSD